MKNSIIAAKLVFLAVLVATVAGMAVWGKNEDLAGGEMVAMMLSAVLIGVCLGATAAGWTYALLR